MRWARRDPVPTAVDNPGTAPEPGGTPPKGAVVAAFAGVLDGRRLWVAVPARPGALAVRRPGGDVLAVPVETTDDPADPRGHLAARLDLAGVEPGDLEVVVTAPGGRAAAPVWTPPLPPRPVPPYDGRQLALRRTKDGLLQVRVAQADDAVELARVTVTPAGLEVTLDGEAAQLALVADDDTVIATYPVSGRTATITAAELGQAPAQVTKVLVGTPGAWRPVRRRANDLAEPGRAAPMPQLYDGDSDDARLRLRWSGRALLQARLFGAAGSGVDA